MYYTITNSLRALFEGGVDGLEPDVDRAVELWQHADKLGSTEARYCLASCVRDGIVFEVTYLSVYLFLFSYLLGLPCTYVR
jgi:hypothetical protein